jgi:hypothetical protein
MASKIMGHRPILLPASCDAGKNQLMQRDDKKSNKMGCPALGVSVAFLKQPDAVPGRAPLKK